VNHFENAASLNDLSINCHHVTATLRNFGTGAVLHDASLSAKTTPSGREVS